MDEELPLKRPSMEVNRTDIRVSEMDEELPLKRPSMEVNRTVEKKLSLKASSSQIKQMVSHPAMASDEWKKSLNLAAIDILDELPISVSSTTSVDEIINLALKINANSFALYSPKRYTEFPIGIGIYPFAALCNHSCAPNVHYTTSVGGSIEFVALQDIEEGDEIFDAYTDIYSSYSQRQEVLLMTKHFICTCSKCLGTTASESMEALLCQCGAILKSDSKVGFKCDNVCKVDRISIESRLLKLEKLSSSANDFIKLGDQINVISIIGKFINESDLFLHEDHALRLPPFYALMNAYVKMKDLKNALEIALLIFGIMDRTGPKYWPDKLEISIQIMKLCEGLNDPRSHKWALMVVEMATVLFGKSHEKTLMLIEN
jgi:hypothetical protein